MKKLLSILSVLTLFLFVTSIVYGEQTEYKYGEEYYITDADGENRVCFTYDIINGEVTINDVHVYKENTDLVFPSEIGGYPVKKVENISVAKEISHKENGGTYSELTEEKIKSVTFEEGIESLSKVNFSHCKSLTDVKLADSINSIEEVHFSYLPELVKVEMSNGLEYAHYFSIFDCPKLKEIKIPKSLKYTEHGFTFARCTSLTSVTIPSGLEGIPQECFYGCSGLKNVTIENGVKTIDEMAFAECTALKSITLPQSVITIGKSAFLACENLNDVTLSKNLKYIGEKSFANTAIKNIQLPNGSEEIGDSAFAYTPLSAVTIPKSVKNIDRFAFNQCANLKKLTISDTSKVNQYAFAGCKNLSDVTVNEEMKRDLFEALLRAGVEGDAPCIKKFYDEFDGDFVIFDGNYLAKYKGNDRNPVIPEGVTELGGQAFNGTGIDSVTFPGTAIDEIPSHCFQGSKIRELTIPGTVRNIRDYAFYGCNNLEQLTVESGVKSISDNAFMNCSSLTEENVSIAKGVRVGEEAFKQTPLDKEWMDGQEIEETPKPTETTEPTAQPTAEPTVTPVPEVLTVKGGEEIKISIDGTAVEFDVGPFIDENGRTQVPIRAVAEMLKAGVDWDDETKTASVTNNSGTVTITVGSDIMTVSGEHVKMDTAAIIKDSRTFIPVRFVAEALGLTVKWVE